MATKTTIINKNKPPHKKGEVNKCEDIHTKPNQAMSIREIMYRNTTGMAFDNTKTPYYEEEATFESTALNTISQMEPTEKLQHLEMVSNKVKSLQDSIKADEEAKVKAIAEAQAATLAGTQTENKETTED